MKKLLIPCFLLFASHLLAQPFHFSQSNVHSHNDYEQKIPFWLAYNEGFGSIEADIFLQNGELIVAHEEKELALHRTLEAYYLRNLQQCVEKNGGHPFADTSRKLLLLIDIKTDSITTLNKLIELLKQYPSLTGNPALKFVITGNRPNASLFSTYPSFIYFDGVLSQNYGPTALSKIVLFSDNFKDYSQWNGMGIVPATEKSTLDSAVAKSHRLNKPVRFWNAPDFINAWYQLMHLGVDYINTDHIAEISAFMQKLPENSYTNTASNYHIYQPTYKTDDGKGPVKNVIMLIGDGTGLAQLYAGYTANRSELSIFTMRQLGLSKTSSYDSYITDSAPGSTAFSAGIKTNNRSVGVDHLHMPVALLPEILRKKKMKTGLVTCGDIADATPADFYAHQEERDNTNAVLKDLINAPVDILMGSGNLSVQNSNSLKNTKRDGISEEVMQALRLKYKVVSSADSVTAGGEKKWIVVDDRAGLSMLQGRGDWLQKALAKTLDVLSANKSGFFIMTEGAQVDHGGHANELPVVATEVIDFDQAVGKALEFADRNGETLVIVTGDHETGGLTLVDGDYKKGYVSGQFSTNDHTAIPVPVFAYGPRSGLFRGVYENSEIFSKILTALGYPAASVIAR